MVFSHPLWVFWLTLPLNPEEKYLSEAQEGLMMKKKNIDYNTEDIDFEVLVLVSLRRKI